MAARRFGFALLAMPLLLASQAMAREAQAPPDAQGSDDREIVVTGKEAETQTQLVRKARAISRVGNYYELPLARFTTPLCPGISGMKPQAAAIMVERIRGNAERLKLPTARDGACVPNILVMFVPNGQDLVKALLVKPDSVLSMIPAAEQRELAADSGPVHAWSITETRSRQGDTIHSARLLGGSNVKTLNVAQSQSHIFLPFREDISNSVVVIDHDAAEGKTLIQLADYATMRAFAQTRAAHGTMSADTILSLFDPEANVPAELTDFDVAYLGSLYEGIANLPAMKIFARIDEALERLRNQREEGSPAH
jgi:hypothetical protein